MNENEKNQTSEEQDEIEFSAESMRAMYKGKMFQFIFVPVLARSPRELKHWENILKNPEELQKVVMSAFAAYFDSKDKKETEQENRGVA